MATPVSELYEYIQRGRETRNLEYKGTRGAEPFAWGPDDVRAKIARTAMAMANIGGGTIVIGMDQVGADRWDPNGVEESVEASYQQDLVQQYVNRRADPYVELTLHHVELDGKRFIVIEVAGFRELPVVCTAGSGVLRQGAVYTRSYSKHETVEIQSQSEMRELLDRAIQVGVQSRLRPVFAALRAAGLMSAVPTDAQRFESQRGGL